MNKAICTKCMRKRFAEVDMNVNDADSYVDHWWAYGHIYCNLEGGVIDKVPITLVAPVGCPYFLEQVVSHQEISP